MDQATTRITAADFLTPPHCAPELAGYSLAANGAGRIGGVRLTLEHSGDRTRLSQCYQQIPLRVLPLDFGAEQPALIYLLNPTAGLLDGDAQLVSLTAEPGSRAFVTGQSATRIHPCLLGFSTQQWRVTVKPGAILVILPGTAIPFQGCRYYQMVRIHLEEGAHVIWGDIWTAGRYARGDDSERFQFQTIVQDLHVTRGPPRHCRLLYRDRFCWRGPWDQETAAWHFGHADCYGSLFSTIPGEGPVAGERRGVSPPVSQGSFASFKTIENNTCLRWLGPVQWVTGSLTRMALTLAGKAAGQSDPWLLASHDLGPNHWFANQDANGGSRP